MEVKVNGEYIELGNSSPAITKKSVDINNPSARFIDFTNSFKVPFTNENAKKFDNPDQIGSNNRSLDKLYNVEIEDIFKIFQGKGFLSNWSKEGGSLQVVDNSSDLFKALEINLRDISWDDLDTILTTVSIDALDTADIDNCWIWNKLCLHENALQINTDQTAGDSRCKYSRPSFYLHAFLKRAIELQGFTYTPSNVELAFSGWHSDFFFTSYQKTIDSTYNPAGTLAISGLDTNDFEHSDITTASTSINIGTAKTKFRLRGAIESDANISLIITATDNVDPTKITESKLILGVGIQEIDFTSSDFQSDDGMTIDVSLVGTGEVIIDAYLYTLLSDNDFDLSTNFFLGYKIKAYDNLPDLTYFDLFKLVCVVGNEFQTVDNFNKTFSFGSLANLNKLNAVDWSTKFIQGTENTDSNFNNLAQKNWLKYENDLTVNPNLGTSFFLTDNESLQAENDYLKLNFSASNDVIINSNDISHVKIYNETTRIPDQTINMRLFSISGSNLYFEPIKWDNLKTNYYQNWFNSLYRIRSISAYFNLSKLDVLKWSEKQLVYIDYFKTTFIVLEISNFIPDQKTKVKLLAYGR